MSEPVIIIQGISAEEFWQQLESRTKTVVERTIKEFNAGTEEERLLSAKEVMAMLKISAPTLNSYCKDGKINKLKIGAKTFYKKADVIAALHHIKPYLKPTG